MTADITIEQFENASVFSPQVICSGGMGPCITVSVYEKNSKRGFMIHESNAHVNNNLTPFFDNIILEINNHCAKFEIVVAGGSFDPDDDENEVIESREYVTNVLENYFSNELINYKWSRTNEFVELCLNSETGEHCISRNNLNQTEDEY